MTPLVADCAWFDVRRDAMSERSERIRLLGVVESRRGAERSEVAR
jgi:hypothetical protein